MKKILSVAFLTLLSMGVMLGQTKVTGKVTDLSTNEPISYASVAVKGYVTAGTFTDDNGNYTINMPEGSTTLSISYIGYKTQEIVVSNRSVIDVALEPDVAQIEESFVVAYGTAKKSTYTGSAAVVKAEAIKDMPKASFETALVGTVSGLQMSPGSGQAGSSVNIRIRGTGSMNASNEPLYVIDGVPMQSGDLSGLNYSSNNAMNSINPNDIESITVLKDAAASSLYGSRAANGIIMITTKAGKKGKMNLSFKANVGITPSFAYNNWEKASPEDQIEHSLELWTAWNMRDNQTQYPTYELARARAEQQYNTYLGDDPRGFFNWEDALLRTASFQNYDLSASGGTENNTYYFSLGYTKENGRVYANDLSRIGGRLNVTQKIVKFMELSSNISFSSVEKNGFNDTQNNSQNYFLMMKNLLFDNWWPQNEDGTWHTDAWRTYAQNVIYYDNYRQDLSKINRLSITESLKVDIMDNLYVKTVLGYDESRLDNYYWRAAVHPDSGIRTSNGKVTNTNIKRLKMVSSTTANYDYTFNDLHNIALLAGFEAEENTFNYVYAEGTNLPSLASKTVSTAGTKTSNAYDSGNSMLSFLSKLEYNYDNKYYFSASFRRDGSSKLSPSVRWGNFWSVSGAWKIKNEKFMQPVEWLSNLRVKASYGGNGTMPEPNYGHISLFSYSGYSYNGNPGGRINTTASDQLKWETNYTLNLGIEAGFFDNRLTANIEYYNRVSENLLQDAPISRMTGFTSILQNIGAMKNGGFEIEIGGDIIRKTDFRWNMSINGATLRSRVTKLYEGSDIIWYDPTGGDNQARFVYREGYSPKSFYGKEWAGVDPDNGMPMWYTNNTTATPNKTVNGRPVTYEYDKANDVITGCADPKLFGGINTNISWKGFSVYLNFSYSLGGDIYNAFERYVNDDGYFTTRTRTVKALDYWKKPGDIAQAPRLGLEETTYSFKAHQSRWLYKNNYIRLKNITISYNLPKNIVEKVKLTNCRVYFSGMNLLTFASQNYFDPEVSVYGVKSWEMPIGKTYTFGIELNL